MADKKLESITFPDLPDRYVVKPDIADVTGLQDALDEKADKTDVYNGFVSENIQGSIASFDDGADDIPVKSLVAEIVPLQSGSGDPSPDNVRAISGWTECNVSVADVNIWDEEWEVLNPSSLNNAITSKNFCPCVPGTTYYFSMPNHTGSIYYGALYFYDKDKTQITYTYCANATVTAPSNAYYFKLITNSSGYVYGNTYNNDISINYPSTDHDYHAYDGEVYTISFASAGTVYGGNIDVTSGVLTVDKQIVDLSTLEWEFYAGGNCVAATLTGIKHQTSGVVPDIIAEKYVAAINTDITSGAVQGVGVSGVADTVFCSNHPFPSGNMVYPLATPQTYQLTPTEVKTLLGNNNVWADTGDIDLTYRADLGLYLDKIINA